eukprot:1141678-Pelagomonas_calceolata.AAC.9
MENHETPNLIEIDMKKRLCMSQRAGQRVGPEAARRSSRCKVCGCSQAYGGTQMFPLQALQRSKEQAKESGQSLQDVVAERWGSLGELSNTLASGTAAKGGAAPRRTMDGRTTLLRTMTRDPLACLIPSTSVLVCSQGGVHDAQLDHACKGTGVHDARLDHALQGAHPPCKGPGAHDRRLDHTLKGAHIQPAKGPACAQCVARSCPVVHDNTLHLCPSGLSRVQCVARSCPIMHDNSLHLYPSVSAAKAHIHHAKDRVRAMGGKITPYGGGPAAADGDAEEGKERDGKAAAAAAGPRSSYIAEMKVRRGLAADGGAEEGRDGDGKVGPGHCGSAATASPHSPNTSQK